MPTPTTAHILGRKARQEACGSECVDWAMSLLAEGCEGEALVELAGMSPPHNHFELAPLRDRALVEVGVPELGPGREMEAYAVERWRTVLTGEANVVDVLQEMKDLYFTLGQSDLLEDFYLLYLARYTLQGAHVQHYWEGATRETIDDAILRRAAAFVHEGRRGSERPLAPEA